MPSRLGQNFLASPAWRQRVLAAIAAQPADHIIEIGGGRGELSTGLAESGARLLIVELDAVLAARLQHRFAGNSRVQVRNSDIRRLDLAGELSAMRSSLEMTPPEAGRNLAVGNLPYYITSPILSQLCRYAHVLNEAVLMMQQEVAERVTAPPGRRAYGLLTAWVQAHARPERLFNLPPAAFRPAPQVNSTLLRLSFAPRFQAWQVEPDSFHDFLRAAFASKRKRLWNNLKPRFPEPGLIQAWREMELAREARAEELSPEQLAGLLRRLQAAAGAAP